MSARYLFWKLPFGLLLFHFIFRDIILNSHKRFKSARQSFCIANMSQSVAIVKETFAWIERRHDRERERTKKKKSSSHINRQGRGGGGFSQQARLNLPTSPLLGVRFRGKPKKTNDNICNFLQKPCPRHLMGNLQEISKVSINLCVCSFELVFWLFAYLVTPLAACLSSLTSWMIPPLWPAVVQAAAAFTKPLGEGYPKELCDKDFAELSSELSGAICLKPLFYWVVPSNCSGNSLVLFVLFFGFGVLFWPLIKVGGSVIRIARFETSKLRYPLFVGWWGGGARLGGGDYVLQMSQRSTGSKA